jgi:hypothetical protein
MFQFYNFLAMENKFKVTFWLYTAKKNKQNLTPIYLRVWSNYKFFTRSTGLFIKKSLWDKKAMRAKGVSAEATSINSQLDGLYVKIMNKINQLQMRGQPLHEVRMHLITYNNEDDIADSQETYQSIKEPLESLGIYYTRVPRKDTRPFNHP